MKNIFITGITGQDGLFLTSKILDSEENIKIFANSRSNNHSIFFNKLATISNNNFNNIEFLNIDLDNYKQAESFLTDIKPEIIYNLSGPSSVYKSISDNGYTYKKIINIFENIINSTLSVNGYFPSIFQSSSSEMFGENNNGEFNEDSSLLPLTPYAEAKYKNHLKVLELSNKGLNIKSGIMFNHESEFRTNEYLIMKIINSTINIKNKKEKKLTLGSLNQVRDWTFAGDVTDAIYKITNLGSSDSYVIGAGRSNEIKDIVKIVFAYFNLDWEEFVEEDNKLLRDGSLKKVIANPQKITKELGWEAKLSFEDLILRCIEKKYTAKG